MKMVLGFALGFGICAAVGPLIQEAPARAEAGGGGGGGVATCSLTNGDVNADGGIDVSDAITIIKYVFIDENPQLLPLCGAAAPSGLPDTGQKVCYDSLFAVSDCASAFCPGQDGAYPTGCPNDGPDGSGRFIVNDGGTPEDTRDDTVTDACTGLMWQRDTADVNGDGQSTDQDFLKWCGALAYCENLDFAGHTDWRLPNVRELQSIVDYGVYNPSIDPVFGALSSVYWSSSTLACNPDGAWFVSFSLGLVLDDAGSTSAMSVPCVVDLDPSII